MSIRVKIFIGLVLVFSLLIGAVNLLMLQNFRVSDEKSVKKDLNEIQRNAQFYVRQDLLVNADTIGQDSFSSESENIVDDLSKTSNLYFAAYDLAGQPVAPKDEAAFAKFADHDLKLAVEGKTAYTIRSAGGKTTAALAFPVVLNGQAIGILRCVSDYSAVYSQSDRSVRLVNLVILSGFVMCLLFGAILSRSVISPIRRLCLNLKSIAGDLQDNHLDPDRIKDHIKLARRDEIGDLSRSIADLLRLISRQMAVIGSDRDELKRVSAYRRDFYNIVTHELKTPLTSIRGYAEVARENGFTDRAFFETAMTRIVEESDRLHEMVVSLLEKSSLHSAVEIPFERVSLSDIVQSVCESMKYKAGKYGREICFQPDAEAWVLGNAQALKELVINLLDNAVKYASESGIDVRVGADAAHVTLEVRNRADNVSPAEAGHLFLPFRQSREPAHERGSVGLGLSICKQIAENHRGSISVAVTDEGIFLAAVCLPVYRGMLQ